jgi:four helix bundle protein
VTIKSFRDLIAWQKAMELVVHVYQATESFPQREMFGLVNQMRRAAVSVPSNIAEGQGRLGTKEFRQFLGIARGSLQEVLTQIEIARRLEFLTGDASASLDERACEVARIVNGLLASLTTND